MYRFGFIEPREDVTVVLSQEIRVWTEGAWRRVRTKLEGDGYTISGANRVTTYATLYWPRAVCCGNCHREIDHTGVALHQHQCEYCSAFTSIWYPKPRVDHYYDIVVFDGKEYRGREPLPFPEAIVIRKLWVRSKNETIYR